MPRRRPSAAGPRPGVRRRSLPRRGRSNRRPGTACRCELRSASTSIPPPSVAAVTTCPRRASNARGRAPPRLRRRAVRPRDRQPAVPVADGGRDDPWRRERSQRRAVRRRRRRVPGARRRARRPTAGGSAFVLPQSILGARDARRVRAVVRRARRRCSGRGGPASAIFDAQVHTCALAFQFPDHPRLRQDFGDPARKRVANVDRRLGRAGSGGGELVVRGDVAPGRSRSAGARHATAGSASGRCSTPTSATSTTG